MTVPAQPGILQAVPPVARYVTFAAAPDATPEALREALRRLGQAANGGSVVVGLGASLIASIGEAVPGLREFPHLSGHGVEVPSTPVPLWCWLRGDDDLGFLLHAMRQLQQAVAPAFRIRHVVDAFRHALGASGHGKDLTGFEDGTENPTGDAAIEAALVQGQGDGLDGSSFVAVQQWVHDFDAFEELAAQERDHYFGRRRDDNEELEDSPTSAHVKRTAQESFTPPAFVVRRSMPWLMSTQAGLMFVAFGRSLDAFEAQLRRMAGQDDGITDAVFRISKPVNGAYFWCPPVAGGRIDLRQLGL